MLTRFIQRIFPRIAQSSIIMSSTASEETKNDSTVSEPPAKKEKGPARAPELSTKLIWIDCEMTGLDPEINKICEIAALITEGDLTVSCS